MLARSFFLSLLLCLLSTTSHALDRPLPANAKAGELNVSENRSLMIDGTVRQLSAGAQIRTQQNTIIQPQTLTAHMRKMGYEDVPILYTVNNQGHVHRIWILTQVEADQYPLDKPAPTTPTPGAPTPGR